MSAVKSYNEIPISGIVHRLAQIAQVLSIDLLELLTDLRNWSL